MIPWLWLVVAAWLAFVAGILFHAALTWAQHADHEAELVIARDTGFDAGWEAGLVRGREQERCMALAEQQIDAVAEQAWRG